MRRLVLLLALALLAAGCVKRESPAATGTTDDALETAADAPRAPAPGTPAAGAPTPAAPSPPARQNASASLPAPRPDVKVPAFAVPVLLGRVAIGAEPSVAVAPDSTVYVATPLSLWRSDDKGASFQPMGPPACPLVEDMACPVEGFGNNPGLRGGNDASLAVADDGTVLWAGMGSSGPENLPFQLSRDRGATWTDPDDLADDPIDRQWIVAGAGREIHVSWRELGARIATSASRDGGASWSAPVEAAEDGKQGPIAIDRAGARLYLPHVADREVRVARSLDGGATWNDSTVAALEGAPMIFPVAALDAAGTLYVVWADGGPALPSWHTAMPSVWLAASQDAGATWTAPRQLSTSGVPALFPWVDAGAPGRVVVAWYEATDPLPLGAPNTWHVAAAVSTTADLAEPVWKGARVTPEPIHVGNICPGGGGCTRPVEDRSLLDFFEVRILPEGGIVLAFAGDGDLRAATTHVYATRMIEGTPLR